MTMGRPRLETKDKRVLVGVYLWPHERDQLALMARLGGYRSLSSFLRTKAFGPLIGEGEDAHAQHREDAHARHTAADSD